MLSICGMAALPWHDIALALCIFLGAALYSSVGHGGASAYIAVMALFGVSPATMKPTALVLNIAVASLGALRYVKAGQFRWRALWPFLLGALPFAFVGGAITLPGHWYKALVGVILWVSALRLLWPRQLAAESETRDPPILPAIAIGVVIGFLSGITGTGGGIFLSPVLMLMAWAQPKQTSGIAALFILANSVAGLAGNPASLGAVSPLLPLFAVAALAGALIGTTAGIRFRSALVVRSLGVVLLVAGAKLVGVY